MSKAWIYNHLFPFFPKTSTNVTHLDCHLSINTWLIFVMMMLTVQTQKDLTTARVSTDTLAQGNTVQVQLQDCIFTRRSEQ